MIGLALAVGGLFLLEQTDWREVLAGALLAWSVAVIAWSFSAHRSRRADVVKELRRVAELDVVHARLNQIAARVGAPLLGLQGQIEHVTNFRERRLAHFTGLDELAPQPHGADEGAAFWDVEAQGGEF
jgi:hypothetical protein